MEIRKYDLLMEISRIWKSERKYSFMDSADVFEFTKNVLSLHRRESEVFVVIALNSKLEFIGYREITTGCQQHVCVEPMAVFKFALLSNAFALLFCHNHPSGDANPSRDDILCTERLKDAGALLGIEIIDHCIIAEGGCMSLRDAGYLDDEKI